MALLMYQINQMTDFMKYTNKLLATIAALSLLVIIGCSGGEDPPGPGTEDEIPGEEITGTWVQGTITGPAQETFTDFSIAIGTTSTSGQLSYTTQNTNTLVFPSSGTFTLPDNPNFDNGAQVTREDGVKVDISLVNNQLRMVLTVDADSSVPSDNSRVAEVSGEYTFLLDKDAQ